MSSTPPLCVRDLSLGDKFTTVTRGELAVAVIKAPDDDGSAKPGAPAADAAAKTPEVIKKGKEDAEASKTEEKK